MRQPKRDLARLISVMHSVNGGLYQNEANVFRNVSHHLACGLEVCPFCKAELFRMVAHKEASPHIASLADDALLHSGINRERLS